MEGGRGGGRSSRVCKLRVAGNEPGGLIMCVVRTLPLLWVYLNPGPTFLIVFKWWNDFFASTFSLQQASPRGGTKQQSG